jgi:hypothetical protein
MKTPARAMAAFRCPIALLAALACAAFSGAASRAADRNNLWHQFRAFADAVRGIDPPAERFEPLMVSHPRWLIVRGDSAVEI